MTKQKFYELCVRKTLENVIEEDKNLSDTVEKLGNIYDMSINEIFIRCELLGLNDIPRKENFKKWGIGYLCQILGFVARLNDYKFTKEYFNFLKTHRSLFKNKGKDWDDFGELCYSVLVDNLTISRDFCCTLASFMVFEFKNSNWFDKFLKLSTTFCLFDSDAMDEHDRIKYGKTLSETITEIVNRKFKVLCP